jgi:hypothetical protein
VTDGGTRLAGGTIRVPSCPSADDGLPDTRRAWLPRHRRLAGTFIYEGSHPFERGAYSLSRFPGGGSAQRPCFHLRAGEPSASLSIPRVWSSDSFPGPARRGGEESLWGSPWPLRPGVPDSNPTYPPRNGAVFADGISSRMTDAAPWIGP